jgi:hypothetical protein
VLAVNFFPSDSIKSLVLAAVDTRRLSPSVAAFASLGDACFCFVGGESLFEHDTNARDNIAITKLWKKATLIDMDGTHCETSGSGRPGS